MGMIYLILLCFQNSTTGEIDWNSVKVDVILNLSLSFVKDQTLNCIIFKYLLACGLITVIHKLSQNKMRTIAGKYASLISWNLRVQVAIKFDYIAVGQRNAWKENP